LRTPWELDAKIMGTERNQNHPPKRTKLETFGLAEQNFYSYICLSSFSTYAIGRDMDNLLRLISLE
jgi:hypothetical protein